MHTPTRAPLVVRGVVDPQAIAQLVRCMNAGNTLRGVLCADGHIGYSQPIGAAIAYREQISPSGVGYDIACGNKAVRTDVCVADVRAQMAQVMDAVWTKISFGVGGVNARRIDHPVLDAIRTADFAPQRALLDLAANQLGTVGAGNHYVDVFAGDDGYVWVGVHCGSRGFGHRTAAGFLALAQGKAFDDVVPEGDTNAPPLLLDVSSARGQAYLAAMQLAGAYAYAGRDIIAAQVLDILGARSTHEVHNHHNFAWHEQHQGEWVWVVRKGCTPAWPQQQCFVGATMGEAAVILEGCDTPAAALLLHTTVHGAGRAMSRTQAQGRRARRWTCNTRACAWVQEDTGPRPAACPRCGNVRLTRRFVTLRDPAVDWMATKGALRAAGIERRGGGADEDPGAYKRLADVLAFHADTVRILHHLTPLGVAMAEHERAGRRNRRTLQR